MNERYGHDPYGQQPHEQQQPQARFLGYDEYGQPVYGYDEYGPYAAYEGYDAYGQAQQPAQQGYDQQGYDPHGAHAQQQTRQQEWTLPQQGGVPQQERYEAPQSGQFEGVFEGPSPYGTPAPPPDRPQSDQPQPGAATVPPPRTGPGAGARTGGDAGASGEQGPYDSEQFAFVEDGTDDSEDVIDWLKFTESRTERREEARRRGRNRVVALVVVLALVLAGGAGYLWYAGKLPGLGKDGGAGTAAAGRQRDVIVVHLRSTDGGGSSTALLVDNGADRGNTVLLPNSLAVSTDGGGTTTLGKSVEDEGAGPTRDALSTLLGADIKGTWRLDTPYLENLVELVGGISLDANATVPAAKKGGDPLVTRGHDRELNGRAAVAYATYRAPGEPQTRQLERFGQVMQHTLRKLSSDPKTATRTVESLGQIPDPSLSESELGASLAELAARAKQDDYRTRLLPVLSNGTLSRSTSEGLVKDVLGGTVKNSDPDAATRVKLVDAAGSRGPGTAAHAALVNGGYTVVGGGTGAQARARSRVTYSAQAQRSEAEEVAKTLGLPGSAVSRGDAAANADVTVVLGRDYQG